MRNPLVLHFFTSILFSQVLELLLFLYQQYTIFPVPVLHDFSSQTLTTVPLGKLSSAILHPTRPGIRELCIWAEVYMWQFVLDLEPSTCIADSCCDDPSL